MRFIVAMTSPKSLLRSLCDLSQHSPVFISLFLPGPPASVMCGVMSGATLVGPESLPSTTRMVVVRVPADATSSNRYLAPTPGALSNDLQTIGLPLAHPIGVDAAIRELLAGGSEDGLNQIPASEQVRLTSLLDETYLDAKGPTLQPSPDG